MATVVTKSIGSGGGRDYSTLQSWEDAKPASLTASDQIWRGEAYSTTEFATTLVVSGSTTDATRYCELTVAAGHSFADHADKLTNALRYNASSGVGLRTTTAWGATLTASENYFRLSRMQVQNASTNGTAVAGTGTNVTIDQCIVECNGGRAVDLNTGAVLTNSLFVGRKSGADSIASLWNATVANCVFAAPSGRAPTHAIRRNYWSSFSMTNCAVFGASTLFTGSSGATFSACYTDNASPPSGFTQVAYDTSTGSGFESITDGSHDYRIKSTSALKDAGTSSGAPSVDIVGSTRPQGGAYDVGAWEYAAGGATLDGSLIDDAAASDIAGASLVLAVTLIDGAAGADVLATTAERAVTLLEAASAIELCTAAATRLASLTDSAVGAETLSAGLIANATLLDAATAADLASAVSTLQVQLTEAASAADLLTATRIANAAVQEAAATSDTITTGTTYAASTVEASVTAEALSAAATLVVQLIEAGNVLDQLAAAPAFVTLLTEAAQGSDIDSAAVPTVYSVTVTELAAALDLLAAAIGSGVVLAPGRRRVAMPDATQLQRTVQMPGVAQLARAVAMYPI